MGFFRFLFIVAFVVVVAVFAFVNNDLLSLDPWPFNAEVTISLSVLIVALVLWGFLFGKIDSWFAYSPLRSELRVQRRQNKKLNAEQQKLAEKVEGLRENLENMGSSETSQPVPEKKSKFAGFKSKISSIFKRKPKQEDFWCL
ncbi:MAG: LapA family protein [Alphaproteobacteria bacterium]|nr:LapA family protein [Alphaproteobacteria bacterium]